MAMEDANEYYEEKDKNPEQFPIQEAPKRMGDVQDPNSHVQYGTVINVPLCSLSTRRVTELKECFLALYDTFMIYRVLGKYEDRVVNEELATEEWVEKKANYRWTRPRQDLAEISMFYDNHEKLYTVQAMWRGAGEYNWHFEKGQSAKKLHDVLQNYLITRDWKPAPAEAKEGDNGIHYSS